MNFDPSKIKRGGVRYARDLLENNVFQFCPPLDSPEDKMAVKKAIKVVPIAQQIYDMEETQVEDVVFKLFDIEQIALGESFKIVISVHVRAAPKIIVTVLS